MAWALALRDTPMMASPHEYRETLYQILFVGELTPEMEKKAAENAVRNAQESIGKGIPQAALDALAAQEERARVLAAERAE